MKIKNRYNDAISSYLLNQATSPTQNMWNFIKDKRFFYNESFFKLNIFKSSLFLKEFICFYKNNSYLRRANYHFQNVWELFFVVLSEKKLIEFDFLEFEKKFMEHNNWELILVSPGTYKLQKKT